MTLFDRRAILDLMRRRVVWSLFFVRLLTALRRYKINERCLEQAKLNLYAAKKVLEENEKKIENKFLFDGLTNFHVGLERKYEELKSKESL